MQSRWHTYACWKVFSLLRSRWFRLCFRRRVIAKCVETRKSEMKTRNEFSLFLWKKNYQQSRIKLKHRSKSPVSINLAMLQIQARNNSAFWSRKMVTKRLECPPSYLMLHSESNCGLRLDSFQLWYSAVWWMTVLKVSLTCMLALSPMSSIHYFGFPQNPRTSIKSDDQSLPFINF